MRHLNGERWHPLYSVWCNMKDRCLNVNSVKYADYGGRGITVCSDWRYSFPTFYQWATLNGYTKGMILDRIDNNGSYSPENCRWTTDGPSQNNRRSSLFVTAFGERLTVKQWSRDARCVVGYHTLLRRVHAGWSPEVALTTPYKSLANVRK